MIIFPNLRKKKKLKQRKALTEKFFKEKQGKTGEKRKREDTTSGQATKKRKTLKAAFQKKIDTPLLAEIKQQPQLGDYLRSRFFFGRQLSMFFVFLLLVLK